MAVDKLVDSTQLDSDLTSVANAIRTKGGTSASLAFPAGFVSAVQAIPSGGGGSTVVASGTFTGQGEATNNGCTQFCVGKKMAKTDFIVRVKVKSTSAEFDRSTDCAFVWLFGFVDSSLGYYTMTGPDGAGNLTFNSSFSVDDNNSGTVTTKSAGNYIVNAAYIRNGTVSYMLPNNFRLKRLTTNGEDNFHIYCGNSNALYKWISTKTFDWEVIYFGSNPSTDIVTIS